MKEFKQIAKRFNDVCFSLSREDIDKLDMEDNGPINNVKAMIAQHCYGVKLFDDEHGVSVEMFYVNNDNGVKGDIICLNLDDPDYFQLVLRFCQMLSYDYKDVDAIAAFNTFQTKLRGFLEKQGFYTTTSMELKRLKGQNAIGMVVSQRGYKNIVLIDHTEFYRNFFSNYPTTLQTGRDYVYLMVNKDTGLIKIGTSKKPGYREKTLHSQEPQIHIIALWCCDRKVEKYLHNKFEPKKVRGEWFRLNFRDLKEIEDYMKAIPV